jgi:hypothetical protein
VLEGKDGWLFLAEVGSIEDYRGLLPFSPRDLARWQQALESRHDWLAGQGIHYLFVICPDKHTVYPEYMPDRVNRVGTQTRLDQLVQYMKEHSGVEILDLRPALKALKKERLCYQPQESHWNDVGAFVAYQQVAARLRWWYPDLRVADLKDCTIFQRKNTETDLLRLQGKTNLITVMDSVRPNSGFAAALKLDPNYHDESRFQVRHSWRAHAPAGKLLMIHDSFGIPLVPFLAEHAREGWYVWSKGGESLSQDVRTFQPDVVIEEVVERALCGREPSPVDVAVPPAGKPDPGQRHGTPPSEPHS